MDKMCETFWTLPPAPLDGDGRQGLATSQIGNSLLVGGQVSRPS